MSITKENVQAGHNAHSEYDEGIVRSTSDHGIVVQWADGGNDYFTWEEVVEQGLKFS